MNTIFISHAGPDADIAKRLHDDLKNVGHDVRLDLQALRLGDDIISFMNNSIADSHVILVIYSQHTPTAIWQELEINAAVWNNVSQDGGKLIVLRYGTVTLPPLLGLRCYGDLDGTSYDTTLQKLCSEIAQQSSATSQIYEALREESSNPFWRVRAEYFDEHIPALLSQAFSPPDAAKIQVLEQMKPCFLEGSRGTGKTMLLLSLRARILHTRTDSAKTICDLFGCYVRLDRGAFCNAGLQNKSGYIPDTIDSNTLIMITDLFSQELYIGILESLISEISFCAYHDVFKFGSESETHFVRSIEGVLPASIRDFSALHFRDLISHWSNMRSSLAEYIRKKFIYREDAIVPFACFDLHLFERVIATVRNEVPVLSRSQITILLDEYENLLPYQKIVVNGLIKLGPPAFSIKISRKVGSEEVSATTTGQELQETHDYNRVSLIYSVDDDLDFSRYTELLRNMVRKIPLGKGRSSLDLATLLPSTTSHQVSYEDVLGKVLTLLRIDQAEFESLSPNEQKKKLSYYRESAIFRCIYGTPGKRTKKHYSGYIELSFISSGVIRFFQEILGMAYYLQSHCDDGFTSHIHPTLQSEAVHTVSTHNLAMLSRNVETYGEQLKYFLLDLGDCLRQKLLHHSSEPEAARIAIRDPDLLRSEPYRILRRVIDIGIKEGVFQQKEGRPGMRPKHVEDPQPVEINIARLFAPALEISPRLRWKSYVRCTELLGLLDEGRRTASKREIIRRFVGSTATSNNLPLDFPEGPA